MIRQLYTGIHVWNDPPKLTDHGRLLETAYQYSTLELILYGGAGTEI